jgi:hypothetical protein
VYFVISDGKHRDSFIIALRNPATIERARAIAAGQEAKAVHVSGTVIKGTAPYNPRWHFHLEPDSISFFENAIEVCDSTTSYVDAHLGEVGGAFLPNAHWCPWESKVVHETRPARPERP